MTSRGSDKSRRPESGIGIVGRTWHHWCVTTPLHVHRYGPATAPQVLAIHGVTGHGRRWETIAGHLSDVAIVAPDLIGHGRSTWAAPWTIDANVEALITLLAEAAEPVVVVGHSFGGAIALRLAEAAPDMVAALVLLDPAVGLDGEWMAEIADDMFTHPDYTDRAEARQEKASGAWADVDDAQLDAELDEHLIDLDNGRVNWRISIPAMLSYWSELARPISLPRTGTPTTLVVASRTQPPYVTDELRTALADRLGDQLTVLELDCDHMVAQALPAQTASHISDRLPR